MMPVIIWSTDFLKITKGKNLNERFEELVIPHNHKKHDPGQSMPHAAHGDWFGKPG
jgi:hypothetical protein